MAKPMGFGRRSTDGIGYERDLAEIHHLHYDTVARSAAEELILRLDRRGLTSGLVVDLGCGSGVTADLLVKAGFDVHGVDISPEMIALAEVNAPGATFECASLFEVDIPDCVAVTAISEAVNYAFETEPSSEMIMSLLTRIEAALSEDGLVMLDIATTDRLGAGEFRELRTEGDDHLVLVRAECSEDGRRLVRDITLFRRTADDLWRRADERHTQRLYHPEEITESLLNVGFRVDVLSGYSDYLFPSGWNGFVGRKSD